MKQFRIEYEQDGYRGTAYKWAVDEADARKRFAKSMSLAVIVSVEVVE